MFMGKMIQVASLMERHLPQILNQQYFFFFILIFLMLFQSIYYSLPLKILVSNYFNFTLCICQCFGHRLLYYCQRVLAVFLQVLETNQPPLALNKVIVKYCTNKNVYSFSPVPPKS